MSEHNVIAVDLGASSGRLLHIRQKEDLMDMREIHRFSNEGVRVSGRIYTDVLYIYHEIVQGLKKTVHEIDQIDGIGIDAWGHDFVILDQKSEMLRTPYQYRDPQSKGMIKEAERLFGKERLFYLTGMKDFWCNSVYQIMGIRERNGDILKYAGEMLLLPDFLAYLLTGNKAGEYTSATLTQMYDQKGKKWVEEIMNKVGLQKVVMPKILPHGTVKGYLTGEILSMIGLSEERRIPVYNIAEHDTAAAAYAALSDSDRYVFISSGTWSIIGTILPEPVINESVYQSGFSNEGAAYGKTKLVKTVMGMWFIQELRKIWERNGQDTEYGFLIEQARNSAPFARFIDVEDEIFNSPINMEDAINQFLNKTCQMPAVTQGEFYRAVMESLAYTYRYSFEQLKHLTGKSFDTICFLGGAVRDTMFCQFIADATGCKIYAGPVEATAAGNALMQLEAFEDIRSHELAELRKNMKAVVYVPENTGQWTENYVRFRSVIKK